MSVLELPVQPTGTESRFEASVLLDGARYRYAVYTNAIDRKWYLDLENDDASSRVIGIPLSNGTDMLYPYRHLDMPPGMLFVDLDDDGDDPGLEAFADGRCKLLYAEDES